MAKSGESFEKLIAKIQAKIDPSASVSHNEFIVDRLGQRRQFDVVIRGKFAGRAILGIFECKDLRRKVGTPEVDAFNTKAQDANANFKIIASRSGFSKPAVDKARHYGIGLVSLLDPDILKEDVPIGDWWTARVYRWGRIGIQARPTSNVDSLVEVMPEKLLFKGLRVLDWFQNYLLKVGHEDKTLGWVEGFQLQFNPPVMLEVQGGDSFLCSAIDFFAERECSEYERFVPVTAEALVDWHTQAATIPPGTTISTQSVTADLHSWPKRDPSRQRVSAFLSYEFVAHDNQFEFSAQAPDLDLL
jgi:Restriction endonuclease